MKRLAVLLSSILFILALPGCNSYAEETSPTVSFYYLVADMEYKTESTAIVAEAYNTQNHRYDFKYLVEQYMCGPANNDHTSPFPQGTRLSNISIQDNIVYIILTDEIASLSGHELTVACACLTLTILDITQAESVTISAQKALLNNAEYITMDTSCILLSDSVKVTK